MSSGARGSSSSSNGVVGDTGAAKGGEKPAEEVVVEKTAFDVVLQGYEAADKIKIIKEVKTALNLGLKEAKELVEKLPATLAKSLSRKDADELVAKLVPSGAKLELA